MAKEFNLDDYQYVVEKLAKDQWKNSYEPFKNHLREDARLGGLLYEHEGAEWEHVQQLPASLVWTLIEEDGQLILRNGFAVNGRIGYVHAKHQHNANGVTIFVEDITEADL